MAVQDDHMIRNIQDVGRLIAKLLLHEQQPDYRLPENEEDYTEADELFSTVMKLAEEGKINEAENELYMGMVEDDADYLELALTFYLYLNDMDGDFLDDNDYSREEVLEGMKDLASDWGVTGLKKPVEQLLQECLELGVSDGNILPHLRMTGEKEHCVFLNKEGRCSIHAVRPGFCRLFPLGRLYEDGGFKYILQIHECPKTNRSKIKVKKWIDTPDLKNYEKFVNDWHYFLLDVQEVLYNAEDPDLIRNLNLFVVNRFYLKPYDQNQDFYIQFYERLKEGKELLALA